MSIKSQKSIWLCLALMLVISFGASAMPSPIAKVGSASKTVIRKTFDGAKSVVKVPVRVTKDVAIGVRDAGSGLVSHVRSAF